MKKNSMDFLWLTYIIIFELSVFFPQYSSRFMLLIMMINIVAVLINKSNGMLAIFSSFIISNEILSMLNCITLLLILTKINKNETKVMNKKLLLLLILGNSIISAAISNTYINVVFSLLYLLLLSLIISRLKVYKIDYSILVKTIKKIIILEFIVFISILFRYSSFAPSDINYGTLMNAHSFGNLLIVIILFLFGEKNIFESFKNNWLYIILCLIMLYFSDSKSLIVCYLILLIFMPFIKLNIISKRMAIFKFIILLYISLYLIIPVMNNSKVEKVIYDKASSIYSYIYNDQFNHKYKYFEGTLFNELKGYRMLFGFGLGQYGSRFANLFTYDVSYRTNNTLNTFVKENFEPHYNQNYVKYISFYNDDFVKDIHWRSAVLSYPYNSIIAIIGEIGWIGLIVFSLFIEKLYRDSKYKIILYYFIITCLFENYFDMFHSIGLVLFFLSIRNTEMMTNNDKLKAN